MIASVSTAQWQQSQDALRDEVRRVTTLMRSITDPTIPAVGGWNIAEVAMHLSLNSMLVLGQTRQDVSRYKTVVPGTAEVAGNSVIPDMWDNADMNARGLKSDAERDLAVLADRVEQRAKEHLDECAGHSPDEPRQWTVAGTTVPLSALTCNLMNEAMMHGYDMACAAGRKWRIERAHAAMVIEQFFVPVMQTCHPRTFVNADKAANRRTTYQVHLRGGRSIGFSTMGRSRSKSRLRGRSTAISRPIPQRFSWCSGSARVSGTQLPRVSCWRGVASRGSG